MPLNYKQRAFITEFLIDKSPKEAAIRAGYSKKSASNIGKNLLEHPEINAAIEVAFKEAAKNAGVTAEYVIKTIVETIERCRQVRPVRDRKGELVYVETSDGKIAPAYTFDAPSILKGTELLGKSLAMFTEKTISHMTVRPDYKAVEDMTDKEIEERFNQIGSSIK